MLKYFFLWFPMLFIAVINGSARDLWYKKYIAEVAARQLSTLSLIALLGVYIFFTIKKYPPQSEIQALLIGMLWMLLTLGFEFGFGLYRGNQLHQLLDDYNIMKGHIWLLVPIWLVFAPYLSYKILNH